MADTGRAERRAPALGADGLGLREQLLVARHHRGDHAATATEARVRRARAGPGVVEDPRNAGADRERSVGLPQQHAAQVVAAEDAPTERHAVVGEDVVPPYGPAVGSEEHA